jgi:O-antigen/teichoic acid export membrane protein
MVLSKASMYLLIPLLAREIDVVDYGVINLITNFFLLVSIVNIFGLEAVSAKWYYGTEDENIRERNLFSWLFFATAVSIVTFGVIQIFAAEFSLLITKDAKYASEVRLCSLSTLFAFIPFVFINIYRFKRLPLKAIYISTFPVILSLILTVVLVYFYHCGIQSIFLSQCISNVICAVIVVCIERSYFRFELLDLGLLKIQLTTALPIFFSSVLSWIMTSTTIYFISKLSNNSQVSFYQMGANFGSIFWLLINSFLLAFQPFILSIKDREIQFKKIGLISHLYVTVLVLCAMIFVLFSDFIISFISSKTYLPCENVAFIMIINSIVMGITLMLNIFYFIADVAKLKIYSLFFTMGVIVFGLLSFVLIPKLGIEGAALSILFSSGLVASLNYIYLSKKFDMPFYMIKIMINFAILFIIIGLCNFKVFDAFSIVIQIVLKLLIISIFIFFFVKKYILEFLNSVK